MKRSKVLLLTEIKQKDKGFTFLINLAMSELGLHLSIYLIHLPRGLNAVYKYSVSGVVV